MSWLHLIGGLGGILGHGATAWIKGHFQSSEIADVEDAVVAKASYRGTDWEHLALTVVLLGLMLWANLTDQATGLQQATQGMAVASVAWFTGRLHLRLKG